MDNPKFKMFPGVDKQFYFRLQAENGEPILTSEGYVAKAGCENGIESVRENAPLDDRYERNTSTNNKPYFVLKAANGEPIGKSEMYEAEASRENGIEAVKRVAPTASIEDLT
jgi:uncharacterized protein YegP (UPF0339 family)